MRAFGLFALALLRCAVFQKCSAYALAGHAEVADGEVRSLRDPACQPFAEIARRTNCFNDTWMNRMIQLDPEGLGKIFVEVGCNTGINAVQWLERWGTRRGIAGAWRRYMRRPGACKQNVLPQNKVRLVAQASRADPRVLCIEPMDANFKVLQEVSRALNVPPASLQLLHAAVSDQTGIMPFPDGPEGFERGSLALHTSVGARAEEGRRENFGVKLVNVTTVDALMEHFGLASIDALSVDTEGFDPLVLAGASRALETVRYLTFEVHQRRQGPWAETRLVDVLATLDAKGLDCFWAGNNGRLQRLTGCWTTEEERWQWPLPWSNVACARRGDIWHGALLEFEGIV